MKSVVIQFLDRVSNGLADYNLSEEEWDAISNLVKALKILKDATTFFSSNSPNISSVIPAMDAIDEAFASGIVDNHELCAPLRHALSIGKKTLNKYYALTDDSDIYCMAMVLHLSYKLTYFKSLNWTDEWINEAVDIMRKAWTARYKPSAASAGTAASAPPVVCCILLQCLTCY
ncbi:hypothetical protein BT96DRAFT_823836 [Gymnopus androsaceus JB14]|uniref:hAT-like transposase RNase-H fold domain-containing protein n=1 Tax=Gymnopus androsaceus JB14 TaxID=1447944 RepID=A0A6A4HIY2_9AGAR|nr:hypothetical protein BT96DRAFT_823836 [Gymnopus androsaceus JB14]